MLTARMKRKKPALCSGYSARSWTNREKVRHTGNSGMSYLVDHVQCRLEDSVEHRRHAVDDERLRDAIGSGYATTTASIYT